MHPIWGVFSCLAGGRGGEPGGRNVWLEGEVENLLTPPMCPNRHVGGVLVDGM